jgi:hypothetical protein
MQIEVLRREDGAVFQKYGSPRMRAELGRINEYHVYRRGSKRIRREHGWRSSRKCKHECGKAIATASGALVNCNFTVCDRNQLWLSIITTYPKRRSLVSCASVTDAFSLTAIGWFIF